MDCEQFKELIFKKIDNEIDDQEEEKLLEHLKTCKECREDFKELYEIENILQEQELLEVPDSFKGAVISRISSKTNKRFFFRPYFTVAAACIILVVAFYSHAFDSLLSSGNIVGKQTSDKAMSYSSIANQNKDIPPSKLEPYSPGTQSSGENAAGNNKSSKDKQAGAKTAIGSADSDTQPNADDTVGVNNSDRASNPGITAQREVVSPDQSVFQKSVTIDSPDSAGGTATAGQEQDNAAPKAFMSAASLQNSAKSYYMMVTISALKDQIQAMLKNYKVKKIGENEYEMTREEYEKLYSELKKNDITGSAQLMDENSDTILIKLN